MKKAVLITLLTLLLPLNTSHSQNTAQRSLSSPLMVVAENKGEDWTIQGKLDSNSEVLDNGSYVNIHEFEGTAEETIVIDLISADFDGYLILFSPDEEIIAENYDGGEGYNARIVVTLPKMGTYAIAVISAAKGETGYYRLTQRVATDREANLAEATQLNQQALRLHQQGRYSEAEPLYEDALTMTQRIYKGENHPNVAASFYNLAGLYESQGRLSEAEFFYKKALTIFEALYEENHSDIASSLHNLAAVYQRQGKFTEAERLYERGLNILQEIHKGENNRDVAVFILNLASLYKNRGQLTKAEFYYKKALNIFQGIYQEEDNRDIATSFLNLAELYYLQGRYEDAEDYYEKALNIYKRIYDETKHPDLATCYNNLALLYEAQENDEKAERYHQKALNIYRDIYKNEDHPNVATSLNNLAALYYSQRRYSEAEPVFKEALAMWQRIYERKDHPDVATSFNNLAALYDESQERYSEAETFYKKALAMIQKIYEGKDHPYQVSTLNNLATLYWKQNQIPQTLEYFTQSTEIEENLLQQNLIGSGAQKEAYFDTFTKTSYATISLHQQGAPDNPQALELALTTIFRRKGRLLDSEAQVISLIHRNLPPEDQTLLDKLTKINTQLSSIEGQRTALFLRSNQLSTEDYNQQIENLNNQREQLEQQAEELEAQLSRLSEQFRIEKEPVTITAIQQQIPQNTTLIEIFVYRPINWEQNKFVEPRYVAYLLSAKGKPQWVDLGEAKIIDETSQQLLRLMKQAENNQYLVEKYAISYLTSGRDLLRFQIQAEAKTNPLIIANPDYRASQEDIQIEAKNTDINLSASNPSTNPSPFLISQSNSASQPRSYDLSGYACCQPLKGTIQEGENIASLLNNPTLLTGKQANEIILKTAQSPLILHIATHGFFLADIEEKEPETTFRQQPLNRETKIPFVSSENPLLRSGLALAGFNPYSNQYEGQLTALEVTNINLYGTKLVVLSACDTGLGDLKNGDGVYGLRRALVLAGSESQLISLWKVEDNVTQELMSLYYQSLLAGKGRHDALRDIQLEFLNSEKKAHPYFWAAFIPSGNWRKMNFK